MFEVHIKADGPMEQAIMSLFEQLKSVLSDTTTLTSEAAQIRAAVDEFKASNAALKVTIEELRAQNASGSSVTDEQLKELIALAQAKDAAILSLFTPDFVGTEPPATPVE